MSESNNRLSYRPPMRLNIDFSNKMNSRKVVKEDIPVNTLEIEHSKKTIGSPLKNQVNSAAASVEKVVQTEAVSMELSTAGVNQSIRNKNQDVGARVSEASKNLTDSINSIINDAFKNGGIQDIDLNRELSDFKATVIQQADTAKLAQANSTPNAVLQLLR